VYCLSKINDAASPGNPIKIAARPVRTIVLDAGHGGFDQGAQSILGSEKDFALDVVQRTRDLLLRAGFNVRLTRSADVFVPLEDRAAFGNRQSSAVFVSVHFNAGAREEAGGLETYSLAPRGVPSTNSLNLTLSDLQPCIGNIRDPENIALATAMHAALTATVPTLLFEHRRVYELTGDVRRSERRT